MPRLHSFAGIALLAALGGIAFVRPAETTKPDRLPPRHAVLIALGPYDGKELRPVRSPRDEMQDLAAALGKLGFSPDRVVRIDEGQSLRFRPEAVKIRQELKRILDNLEPGDEIVVAIAGHAIQFRGEEDILICPADARLTDRATLVSLREIQGLLERSRAGRKLLVLDICRGDPRPEGRSNSPPLEVPPRPQNLSPVRGVVVMHSCGAGEESLEHASTKRSAFAYFLTQGLNDPSKPGETLLADEVLRRTQAATREYARTQLQALQSPTRVGPLLNSWVLRSAPPLPAPEPAPTRIEAPLITVQPARNLELKVRRATEREITSSSPRIELGVGRDPRGGARWFFTPAGAVSAAPAGTERNAAQPRPFNSLKLAVRKAGEGDVTQATRRFALEVYRDASSGRLIYLTDAGGLTTASARDSEDGVPRRALQKRAMELAVRKAGEAEFSARTRRVGVEVFEETATGNWVFLADTGSVAVLPGIDKPGEADPPLAQHSLEVKVRKPGSLDFDDATRVGIEVYRDLYSGCHIHVSDTGHIAVVRSPAAQPNGGATEPVHQYGLDLRFDAKEASASARRVGVEVYRDPATGLLIGVTQRGVLTILPSSPK